MTTEPATTPDVPTSPPPAPSPWLRRLATLGRWIARIFLLLLLFPAGIATFLAARITPFLLDDQRLDAIVMAVALDWRDFGKAKAEERLQYEIDLRMGDHIGDDVCRFEESPAAKEIACAWGADVAIPFADRVIPLAFESRARILPDGDLQ